MAAAADPETNDSDGHWMFEYAAEAIMSSLTRQRWVSRRPRVGVGGGRGCCSPSLMGRPQRLEDRPVQSHLSKGPLPSPSSPTLLATSVGARRNVDRGYELAPPDG